MANTPGLAAAVNRPIFRLVLVLLATAMTTGCVDVPFIPGV